MKLFRFCFAVLVPAVLTGGYAYAQSAWPCEEQAAFKRTWDSDCMRENRGSAAEVCKLTFSCGVQYAMQYFPNAASVDYHNADYMRDVEQCVNEAVQKGLEGEEGDEEGDEDEDDEAE